MLRKHFRINHCNLTNIRRTFSISTEYDDVLRRIPPTKFEFPEPKIQIPDQEELTLKTVLEVWKLEMNHYIDFIRNPAPEKRFLREVLPKNFDIIVIGSGYIGTSIAYWLRERYRENQSILVIDKNLDINNIINIEKPEQTTAALATGNIRQQFSLKENIDMARISANFFRNLDETIKLRGETFPSVPYKPFGFLTLAKPESEEMMKENNLLQTSLNINNELLTPFQMNQRFPWLNTSDIRLGCHGLQDEGWIDPYMYLLSMRQAAIKRGTIFLEAEPVEFAHGHEIEFKGFEPTSYKQTNHIILKLPDGSYKKIAFGHCILATGPDTHRFTKELLYLDKKNPGLFGMEIPVERRKRYIFNFEAPEGGMELSSPLVVDPTGLFVHRTGIYDYVCGMAPIPEEEPSTDNLDVDYDFFYKRIWPLLANRIPALEQLRLISGYAYYIDHNTYDETGIIGRIPAYPNIFVVAGFGENEFQFSPVLGKAMHELLFDDCYVTADLYNLSYKRILLDNALQEGTRLHEGIRLN